MIQTLTIETLIAKGACADAQEKFAQLFPNGAPLTVATFVNVADQLDWDCAVELLLSLRNQVRLRELVAGAADAREAAYNAACETRESARNAYSAACAAYESACETYDAACEIYDAACETRESACETRESACDAYNASCDAACETRESARNTAFATAFAELYIQQESKKS